MSRQRLMISGAPPLIGGASSCRQLPTYDMPELPSFSLPTFNMPVIEYKIYTAAPPVVTRGPIVPKLYTFTPRVVFKKKGLKINQVLNLSDDLDANKERRDRERRERIEAEEREAEEEAAARRARSIKAAKQQADRLAEETEAAIQAAELKESKRRAETERARKQRLAQTERENKVREEKARDLSAQNEEETERHKSVGSCKETQYCAYKAEMEFKQALYKYSRVRYNEKRDVTIQRNFLHPY